MGSLAFAGSAAPNGPRGDEAVIAIRRQAKRYFGRPLGAPGAAAGVGACGAELPDEVEAASHSQASARRERIFETLPRLNNASFGESWLTYIRTKSLPPSLSARMKGME